MMRVLLIALFFAATSALVAQPSESPLVPTRVLFVEEFEIGDLEDASLPRIDRLEEYLPRSWTPQLYGYPKFMTPALERIPGTIGTRGRRYLRYPVRSGAAAIRSPNFSLRPWMRLRITADLKWEGVGDGGVHVGIVYSNGERVSFVSGTGPDSDWQTLTGESVVPADAIFGEVEVWIDGDHTRNSGEHGIDNIRVEILPRVVLRSTRPIRRVDPIDETPFIVESIGFPQGEYDLDIVFKDQDGRPIHRVSQHKFVRFDRQIEFRPRLRWAEYKLPRGLYSVEISVRAEKGWALGDRGTFVLGGRPLFPHQGAPGRWGLSLPPSEAAPIWMSGLGQIRHLVEWTPDLGTELPQWLDEVGAHLRSVVLDANATWGAESIEALLPLRHLFSTWYWTGDRAVGDPLMAKIVDGASYLRVGHRVTAADMSTLGDRRALLDALAGFQDPRWLADAKFDRTSFDVWITEAMVKGSADPAATLATLLYLSAAHGPQTVYLDGAESLFVDEIRPGELVPQPAMLAWEFVTGFLSDAVFERFEEFGSDGIFLVFRRESQKYIVAMGRGATGEAELFASEDVIGFGAIGNSTSFTPDDRGRVKVPLTAEPLLLVGADVDLLRTVRSLQLVRRSDADPEANVLPLELTFANRYDKPVTVGLELRYPNDWPGVPEFEERPVASGSETRWPIDIAVPKWFGTESSRDVSGDLILNFGDRTQRVPVSVDLPMENENIRVEFDTTSGKLLTVEVTNTTDEPVRLTVFMEVEPVGRSRRFAGQLLQPSESDRFSVAIDDRPKAGTLFVGVIVESTGETINRVFPLDPKAAKTPGG